MDVTADQLGLGLVGRGHRPERRPRHDQLRRGRGKEAHGPEGEVIGPIEDEAAEPVAATAEAGPPAPSAGERGEES